MAGQANASDANTRSKLARLIVALSVVGITAISIVVIAVAGGNRPGTARLVFTSLLPLFGTWVGTVLAFYFARENLQAATDSAIAISTGVQPATSVSDVMIRPADIVSHDLAAGADPAAVKLADLYTTMTTASPPRRRLPIRDSSGAVLYVVHDSTLNAFAQSVGEQVDAMTKTFGDLLAVSDYKALVEAIAFVPATATLAQARSAEASVKGCNDVFVTEHGKRDEPVLGWLTNTLLAEVE